MIQLSHYPYQLFFKFPFKIAHTTRLFTDAIFIKLQSADGKITGWGEATYPPYVDENPSTFADFISEISLPNSINTVAEISSYIQSLKNEFPTDTFSIAALDIALHNFLAAQKNQSIAELYQLKPHHKKTSITIGICNKKEMAEKIASVPEATYFKLKVDEPNIQQIISNFQSLSELPFVIDANQGFKNREKAKYWADLLYDLGVEYMEQPMDKNDLINNGWLTKNTKIPIIADESYQQISDLPTIAKHFNGINVKLMKSGGISEAVAALKQAKSLGLTTMLGCMSESSIAVNAANEIGELANFIDLDGPFLIKNDPFTNVTPFPFD